jgi:AcrR family transcriptional regulator
MARRQDIDGKQLILDAALRLFAEEGVEGVSIRAVNREAGLGPASVHYHFGTKDALVDAVLLIHGEETRAAIAERAKAIMSGEAPSSARDLVTMLAQPYIELIATHPQSGGEWIRLVSRLLQSDPEKITDRATSRLTAQAAAAVYPEATPEMIGRVLRMCFQLLVAQLAQTGSGRRGRAALDLDLLIDFLSGGVDSALSSPEGAELRAG